MTETRQPFRVRCGDCKHEWAAFYLPIPLGEGARILKQLRCPSCEADSSRMFCVMGG